MDTNKSLLDGMVLFFSIVELGSLSAAAKRLGHTPSYVSKELVRLETRLGSRLLYRTTRKIGLTETGRIYYENARRVVADAKLIESRIQSLGDRPYGELKLIVPVIFAQGCFSCWVPEFLRTYPEVTLNVDISDRHVDMVSEGFDLMVRLGNLPDSDLITRELFRTSVPTVASPSYLARRGTPRHPRDLFDHDLITFSSIDVANNWAFPDSTGSNITVNAPAKVKCNEADMERTMVLEGEGITRIPEFAYLDELASGKLVRILTDYEYPPIGVHLVYPNREHLPPKTRAMADFLIEKTEIHFKNVN